jgi:hypothetical protein
MPQLPEGTGGTSAAVGSGAGAALGEAFSAGALGADDAVAVVATGTGRSPVTGSRVHPGPSTKSHTPARHDDMEQPLPHGRRQSHRPPSAGWHRQPGVAATGRLFAVLAQRARGARLAIKGAEEHP